MEGYENVRETTNAQLQETRNVYVEETESVYQEEIRNVYSTVKIRADEEKQKDVMSGKKVTKSPLLIVTIICVICIAILFGAVAYLLSSTTKLQEKLMSEEQQRSDGEKILAGFNSSVKDLKASQNKSAMDSEEKYIKFSKSLDDLQSRQAEEWRGLKDELDETKMSLANESKEITTLKRNRIFKNCEDARNFIDGDGGVVPLFIDGNFYGVYCDMSTDGGNWIVFQRRMDGSVDFYRIWEEYVTGFGNKSGEFWLGLETLHQLTQNGNFELRVDLTDWDGSTAYAKYGTFSISGRSDGYRLTVGEYSGNAGDSLNVQSTQRFTAKDKDLDSWKDGNCATRYHGAWWFNICAAASLNGRYNDTSNNDSGIHWYSWRNKKRYSLKASEMKFRKK